jgi:enoyl-[acyl-carrier protein] reductase III
LPIWRADGPSRRPWDNPKGTKIPNKTAMSAPLAGKVALVTGAARGIGRAIARKLGAAGADVAVNYYNSHDEAEALCAELRALGRRAHAIQGSVGMPDSVDDMFADIAKHFDRIDIVVSNAASGVLKPAMDMSLKHWRWCLETNAFALAMLAQRAVPLMPAGGRIIAMSSLGAQRAMPDYGFIGASKAALESLVRTLAQELGPQGIRVNTVSAGVVDTDALQHFPNREELLADFARRTPAGPVLTPDDVAGAVYLLCLPEAAMITGHTLVVDGGFCISG